MFAYASLAALIASAAFVHAEVVPTAPGPGDIFKEGGQCTFTWDVDASGVWKTMNVQLMTGSNTGMVHITSTPFLPFNLPQVLSGTRPPFQPLRVLTARTPARPPTLTTAPRSVSLLIA